MQYLVHGTMGADNEKAWIVWGVALLVVVVAFGFKTLRKLRDINRRHHYIWLVDDAICAETFDDNDD